MGFIEDVQARTDIGDDIKTALITSFRGEVDPLKAASRKTEVETEITQLSDLGFSDAPGLLAFTRRVFLSDDKEPGIVLFSDNELGLSGAEATGATGKEEMSAAGVLREFIKRLPRSEEGGLKVMLSDQASSTDDHGHPGNGDGNETDEEKATKRAERSARLSGKKIDRAAVRGRRYGQATITAGGE